MSGTVTGPPILADFEAVVHRARSIVGDGGRRVIGITGSPGAGKTTLATALIAALNDSAPDGRPWVSHVPMDGFHLADVELTRLGRLDRKGAPDTFDPDGYAALLERLRSAPPGETVYAPAFDREIEQPIAGSIPIPPTTRLVVTEGNYLLLDEPGWRRARASIDEVWFCQVEAAVRRRRLVERHVRFGKSPAEAEAWVAQVDEPNAATIAATAGAADALVADWSARASRR